MSLPSLDRIDLALLRALQAEGRLANVDLAQRVNLSPSACLRRLQRLESEGVITGYRAVIDAAKLGLGLRAFVRVQLKSHGAADIARFADSILAWDEVERCHALTGDMDYLIEVRVQDLEHFSRFLLDRLLADGQVADVNTSFVLREIKGPAVPAPALRGAAGA